MKKLLVSILLFIAISACPASNPAFGGPIIPPLHGEGMKPIQAIEYLPNRTVMVAYEDPYLIVHYTLFRSGACPSTIKGKQELESSLRALDPMLHGGLPLAIIWDKMYDWCTVVIDKPILYQTPADPHPMPFGDSTIGDIKPYGGEIESFTMPNPMPFKDKPLGLDDAEDAGRI